MATVRTADRLDTEVLVVGAGPTGLALATTLVRSGITPLVVDKLTSGQNTSRAAVIHAHTLEVLDLVRLRFDGLPTRYACLLMLPQDRTEAILAGALAQPTAPPCRRPLPARPTPPRRRRRPRDETLRRPAAEQVLRLAGRLTSMATLKGAPQRLLRNQVLGLLGRFRGFRRGLEMDLSGLSRRDAADLPTGRGRTEA